MSISLPDALSVVFLASIVVEIVPIKINPWKWILGSIGKALNQELSKQVGEIRKDFDQHKAKTEERYANSCRSRIIRASDESRHGVKHSKEFWDQTLSDIDEYSRHGVKHSKEFWDQTLSDIDEYERYCKEHPDYKNHKAVDAIEKIMDLYRSEDWI